MILDAIFSVLFGLLSILFDLFPDFTPPGLYSPGANPALCPMEVACEVGDWLGFASEWVDVALLASVLTWVAGVLVVYGLVVGALFLYRLLPGKAS
ncbi:MAG TPA: hypothetical protein VGA20_09395 [Gemmatimonadales bacterium]